MGSEREHARAHERAVRAREKAKADHLTETQADRIMASGRTQPLTPVEQAFFGAPDHMVKSSSSLRTPINVRPAVVDRLRTALCHDPRFHAIGYSEFIARALDALGCE